MLQTPKNYTFLIISCGTHSKIEEIIEVHMSSQFAMNTKQSFCASVPEKEILLLYWALSYENLW